MNELKNPINPVLVVHLFRQLFFEDTATYACRKKINKV